MSPPINFGQVFVRTIYVWNALALFTRDGNGRCIKPTEGISEQAYRSLRYLVNGVGGCGFWMWIASSKSTDLEKPKKSRLYGAVFVTDVISTKECMCHNVYREFQGMEQFQISSVFDYQLIISDEERGRRELLVPVEVPDGSEARWDGVWVPQKDSMIYTSLAKMTVS
jgi:hypothetical protein